MEWSSLRNWIQTAICGWVHGWLHWLLWQHPVAKITQTYLTNTIRLEVLIGPGRVTVFLKSTWKLSFLIQPITCCLLQKNASAIPKKTCAWLLGPLKSDGQSNRDRQQGSDLYQLACLESWHQKVMPKLIKYSKIYKHWYLK